MVPPCSARTTLVCGPSSLNWQVPRDENGLPGGGLVGLQQHFQKLSERFGYHIPVPENTMNNLGYQLMGAKKLDEAIAVFKQNVELYPGSANVYDSLGEGLEAAGKFDSATQNFQKAIEMATKNNDGALPEFKKALGTRRRRSQGSCLEECQLALGRDSRPPFFDLTRNTLVVQADGTDGRGVPQPSVLRLAGGADASWGAAPYGSQGAGLDFSFFSPNLWPGLTYRCGTISLLKTAPWLQAGRFCCTPRMFGS